MDQKQSHYSQVKHCPFNISKSFCSAGCTGELQTCRGVTLIDTVHSQSINLLNKSGA